MSQSDGNPDGWQPPAVRFGPDYSRFNPANHETGPVQPFSLDALTAADLVGICTGLEARGIDVTQVDLLEVTSTDGQNLNTRVVLDDGQVITGTLP